MMPVSGIVARKCQSCGVEFRTSNRQQLNCPEHLAGSSKVKCGGCGETFVMRSYTGTGEVFCSDLCADHSRRQKIEASPKTAVMGVKNCPHCNRILQFDRCPRHGDNI